MLVCSQHSFFKAVRLLRRTAPQDRELCAIMASSEALPETRRSVWLAICLVLVGLTCAVADATWLEHGNTLYHNKRWISAKIGLARYTMGAVSFMVTQTGLHYNQLNLGVWHGFQEIYYHEPVRLSAASFDCKLDANTYVSFLFARNATGFQGIRLSLNPGYRSVWFESTPERRFTRIVPLDVVPRRGWNHVLLVNRSGLWVTVNGEHLPVLPVDMTGLGQCGFRGCLGDSAVDNVVLDRCDGPPPIVERFDNLAALPSLFVRTFLVATVGVLAVFALTRREPRSGPFMVTLGLWLLVVSGLCFGVEWFYYGPMHPKNIDFSRFPEYRNDVETDSLGSAICAAIQDRYAHEVNPGRRIVFVGSSQTWGSGAQTEDQTWVRRIERRLNAEHAAQGPFECINTGISGAISAMLDPLYLQQWITLKPELCVIDLSFNDPSPDDLVRHVKHMIEANQARRIRTLLVLEPACSEYPDPSVPRKREALAGLAQREHVPYVRMQPYLNGHQREGFLWWDMVHLTPFGQQLFADRLYGDAARELGLAGATDRGEAR